MSDTLALFLQKIRQIKKEWKYKRKDDTMKFIDKLFHNG